MTQARRFPPPVVCHVLPCRQDAKCGPPRHEEMNEHGSENDRADCYRHFQGASPKSRHDRFDTA